MSEQPPSSSPTQSEVNIDSAGRQFQFVNWKIGIMKDEILSLERQMEDLRLTIMRKEKVLKSTWAERLDQSRTVYCKIYLQGWTSLLYARLPRELRDVIYSMCLNDNFGPAVIERSLSMLCGFDANHSDHTIRLLHRRACLLPQYVLLNPAFVGKHVAQEVAEMVHRRAHLPSFGTSQHRNKPLILHLKAFLQKDVFNLGLRTADHISRLHLEIHRNKLKDRRYELQTNLKALLLCRNNRSLRIEICFLKGNSAVDVLPYLNALRKIYASLSSGNITFDIYYKRRIQDAGREGSDEGIPINILNLTHMFEVPQGLWKDHLMALCECVGELWAREKRWLGYRAKRKEEDVWQDMEGETTLQVLDSRGRDAFLGEMGAGDPLWGECWNARHWHESRCSREWGSCGNTALVWNF